jgi:hypothetical protein|tara:strand:+ start:1189 stop:1308 length:120 start_codon:yes stop_codon:yes gene_type:complete
MATNLDISVTKGSLEVIDITLADPNGASESSTGELLEDF